MSNILTLRSAARQLGVHHTTLRRWIALGEGPRVFIKPGIRAVIRITKADLDWFINRYSDTEFDS